MAVAAPKSKRAARPTPRNESRVVPETSGLSQQQKRALQDEITSVNARITFLKSMGCRVNPKTGTLSLHSVVEVHQTGAKGTIEHSGKGFYLHVDGKEHNPYIKQLGGKWRGFNSSWIFPETSIDKVRASFVVSGETTLPPREEVELTFVVREGEEGEILVKGSRAPGREYTARFREMGGRFDGKTHFWRIPSERLEEVQELLGNLVVEEGPEEEDPVAE